MTELGRRKLGEEQHRQELMHQWRLRRLLMQVRIYACGHAPGTEIRPPQLQGQMPTQKWQPAPPSCGGHATGVPTPNEGERRWNCHGAGA